MRKDELIRLLSGKDEIAASLAMKEMLSRQDLTEVIAEYEDTENPFLRKRIQQLSSIFNRICLDSSLEETIDDVSRTPWDVFSQINVVIDRQTSLVQLHELLGEYISYGGRFRLRSTEQFVDYMKRLQLCAEPYSERFVTEYLVSDVLFNRIGNPLVVAVIAHQIARIHGYVINIGTINDKICLRDNSFNVIIPADDWIVFHPSASDFHPLDKRALAIQLLAGIFAASILEQLHEITYTASALLGRLAQYPGVPPAPLGTTHC